MLSAKLIINGLNVQLEGDKDDIVYAISNTSLSLSPKTTVSIKVKEPTIPKSKKEHHQSFTNNQMIEMYQWLANRGDYEIKQFSIVRGGQTGKKTFTVCFIFNKVSQRYEFENPHSEDTFIKSFSIQEVIDALGKNEAGFRLTHRIASNISKNLTTVKDLIGLANTDDSILFANYDKVKAKARLVFNTAKPKFKSLIKKNVGIGSQFITEDVAETIRKTHTISKNIARKVLLALVEEGFIAEVKGADKRSKTWKRVA